MSNFPKESVQKASRLPTQQYWLINARAKPEHDISRIKTARMYYDNSRTMHDLLHKLYTITIYLCAMDANDSYLFYHCLFKLVNLSVPLHGNIIKRTLEYKNSKNTYHWKHRGKNLNYLSYHQILKGKRIHLTIFITFSIWYTFQSFSSK